MKRLLVRSNTFVRAAKRTIKKYPNSAQDIQNSLELLSKDAFHPLLKTHKLKGILKDSWGACLNSIMRFFLFFP